MKTRIVLATMLSLGVFAPAAMAQSPSTPAPSPKGVNAREHRQVDRIKDGKEDKQLTKAELDTLRANEAAIRAEERVYRNSGDGLNKAERKDLQKDLDKTSREIYRARHNHKGR